MEHRAAWADTPGVLREVVLEDGWLRKRPEEGRYAPVTWPEDLAALRERWADEVARTARIDGAKRHDVEVLGVVGVWVRRG